MPWDPGQYERFRDQRLAPALDLIALVRPPPPTGRGETPARFRALDLGCGTGEPTAALLAHLGPDAEVEGLDTSAAMLERAAPRAHGRLRFRLGDVAAIETFAPWDLVFSNAALHWVPDHPSLFARLLGTLRPGAQVAIQMPWNQHHPAHRAAAEVARSAPFAGWLGGFEVRYDTLPLEDYAELFRRHGMRLEACRLFEQLYPQLLERPAAVAEWLQGSYLVPYLERLDERQQAALMDAYRARLRDLLGDAQPYLYTFRRLFLYGVKG